MNIPENCGLLVNGKPLSWYGGAAMLDYSVGETEISAETFQGVNRTSWALLKSFFGRRVITLTVLFKGSDLHAVKVQRSKFNSQLFGRVELYIAGDGFFYDAVCTSMGAEEYGGQGVQEAQIKATYAFSGIRRDALASMTVPAGGSFYCRSTMPLTDCKLTATVGDSETFTGNPVTVQNTAGKTITGLSSVITPSVSGVSALTIQQSNGSQTSTTSVPLGKTVYGGSVDATGGELTETYAGGVYDPANIPAALDALIVDATTQESATPGAIASFDCELGEYPLSGLSVAVEPVQSGSGDPSPDNVRPITGWDSVNIYHSGANLVGPLENSGFDNNGLNTAGNTTRIRTKDYIPVVEGEKYFFSIDAVVEGRIPEGSVSFYTADDYVTPRIGNTSWISVGTEFTIPAGAKYARATFRYSNNSAVTVSSFANAFFGTKTTHTIQLGETVYGGTLDVIAGKMTVEYVKKTITQFGGAWGAQPTGNYAVYLVINDTIHGAEVDAAMMKSNIFQYTGQSRDHAPLWGYGGLDGAPQTQTFVLPGTITSLAEANAWLADNPTECTFRLATPFELTLTPEQISTLQGTNNVWSDAWEISELSYRDGDIAESSILTQSGALISGENVAYPLATPAVSSITPITAPALLSGNSTISGSSGALSLTVGKPVPNPYPLGGAEFSNVSAGDVLVFDGINGAITRNGQPDAANVDWSSFPSLTPGENENDAPDPVAVEYYPTYI